MTPGTLLSTSSIPVLAPRRSLEPMRVTASGVVRMDERLRVVGVERLRAQASTSSQLGPRFAPFLEQFEAAISDDLNTAVALTVLEELAALKKVDAGEKLAVIAAMDAVLGLGLFTLDRRLLRLRPTNAQLTEDQIASSIAFREELRAQQNYAALDRLRDELAAQGVEVMDGDPLGWDWKLG